MDSCLDPWLTVLRVGQLLPPLPLPSAINASPPTAAAVPEPCRQRQNEVRGTSCAHLSPRQPQPAAWTGSCSCSCSVAPGHDGGPSNGRRLWSWPWTAGISDHVLQYQRIMFPTMLFGSLEGISPQSKLNFRHLGTTAKAAPICGLRWRQCVRLTRIPTT